MAKKELTNSEAVLKYVDWLDEGGELEKYGVNRDKVICSSDYALNMLTALPNVCNMAGLYPAVAILLAYLIKNGNDNEAIRIKTLQSIVKLTRSSLESDHDPLAKILDFKYHKIN